ncbi:MAG: hypothetical protein RXR06_11315 [Thermoproteus sp.]
MRFLEFELKGEARIIGINGSFLTLGVNDDVYIAISFGGSAVDSLIFNLISSFYLTGTRLLLHMISVTEVRLEENLSDLASSGGLRVERSNTIYKVRNRVRKLHKASGAKGREYGARYLSITT